MNDFEVKKDFLKDIGNGIMLNNTDIEILNKYSIDYKNCKNVSELIFKIENYLNSNDAEDLDLLSMRLEEFNYYHNTNK